VTRWTEARIWDAVDAWRWVPPSSTRVVTDDYELVVTPGSYALTYVYGFRVDAPERVEERLRDLRERVEAHGGTGARIQVTPRSLPSDLAERLPRYGYEPREEAEVLVWELRDPAGNPRLPEFRPVEGVAVRETQNEAEYEAFAALQGPIFGDPPPPPETRHAFLKDVERKVRLEGHSDRFLAWAGTAPIGRAGLEIVGPVARMWGTGVLSEYRHRGVYGALVRARCESSVGRGAELALVSARVGTSGPILKRHGFRPMGSVRVFEARW
jgi:hypothetical protein